MKTATEILTEARALLAQGNWYQGEFSNPDHTCFCASGAISFCSLTDPADLMLELEDDEDFFDARLSHPGASKAYHTLRKSLPPDAKSIPEWNDDPNRTLPEVLNLFDTAIERLSQ